MFLPMMSAALAANDGRGGGGEKKKRRGIECLRLGRRLGTDKAANWLCRQMIAAKCGKCRKSWRGNISKRRTVAVHPQPSWGRPLRALTLC
jgi:hypothetical protein